MDAAPKKKYQRTVPRGRTRVVEIPAHGMKLDTVIGILQRLSDVNGAPRTYIDSNGRLIVAIQTYDA